MACAWLISWVLFIGALNHGDAEEILANAKVLSSKCVDGIVEAPTNQNKESPHEIYFFIAIGLWCIPLISGAAWISKRRGFIDLRPETAIDFSQELIRRIRRGRDRCGGIYVLRCPDSEWLAVVAEFIKNADCVVIDVTNLSQNVLFELKLASLALTPERLVLAYAVWADEGPKLQPSIEDELRIVIGTETLSRCIHSHLPRVSRPKKRWSDRRGPCPSSCPGKRTN